MSAPPPRRPPVRGLRPVSDLPRQAHLLLGACGLALLGFAVWVTIRLLDVDGRATAILLIALSYLGVIVVAIAVVTLVRMLCSLRAVPYLLGRGVRRVLTGRR